MQSSLGLNDDQLAALPTQVLNVPPYGNWTDQGWNIRFHGNVYKQPNTSTEKLNDLANVFLIGTDIEDLPTSQQDQARNLTASIFVVQQGNETVNMYLEPAPSAGGDGELGGGGAVTPDGGNQTLTLPYATTGEGDFDVFMPIDSSTGGLMAGNATSKIQRLNVYANGSTLGNGTAYLVPPTGMTIISDIDDILRVTKIYQPKEGLLNSFARPFTQWENMPDIYANWSKSLPDMHFHYLTTTPEQVTRNYMDFIYKTYPGGSFDTRTFFLSTSRGVFGQSVERSVGGDASMGGYNHVFHRPDTLRKIAKSKYADITSTQVLLTSPTWTPPSASGDTSWTRSSRRTRSASSS